MHKCFAFCIALLTLWRDASGYLGNDMAETIQLCCSQGEAFARNHAVSECLSSLPSSHGIPEAWNTMCSIAKTQCCKNYYQKNECDAGIDVATSTHSCDSTSEISKICCDECLRGTEEGRSNGPDACVRGSNGASADKKLAEDAFVKCCKKSSKEWKEAPADHNANTISLATMPSLCEEFAPNELCAHHCIPVPGSYRCECNPGFMLMADGRNCKEVSKNRCKPRNPCQHKCNDNGFEVKCSCRRGYELMPDGKSCQDIDECQLDVQMCLPETVCQNLMGTYRCVSSEKKERKSKCPSGFIKNPNNKACDDINECLLPNPPCPFYMCENTVGGFKCNGVAGDPDHWTSSSRDEDRCPPGFNIGVNEECEDVDECVTHKDDCNPLSQFCINTHSSYYCQDKVSKHCPPGFKIDPSTDKCEDINECEDGDDICRSDQICINQLGQYDCKQKLDEKQLKANQCPDGMRKPPGSLYCEDIDECRDGTHLCDMNQHCLNTNGSYECHCKLGYELDITTGACADVNECATGQHDCVPQAQRCDNTVGSYLCVRISSCGTGYVLHHSTGKCEDIDECALGMHNCGTSHLCYNTRGSFRCARRRPSTTTTLAPEYEFEYYDSEEEIEGNQTTSVNETNQSPEPSATTTSTTTTTTFIPVPPPTTTTPAAILPQTTPESIDPDFNNVVPLPTTDDPPISNEIVPTQIIPDATEAQTVSQNQTEDTIQLQFPETSESPISEESKPTEPQPQEPQLPDITHEKPQEPPVYTPLEELPKLPEEIPTDTPKSFEEIPRNPEIETTDEEPEPEPSTNESIQPDDRPDTTFIPPTESTKDQTPPPAVLVNINTETATVTAVKQDDGSVVVDTNSIPTNRWTQVKVRECPYGFEADEYGACFDIDECATNRHSCSGLTETCKNTIGGYTCNCAPGFRRDFATNVCDVVITTSTTTTTTTTTPPPPPPSPPTATSKSTHWGYHDYRLTQRPFRPSNLCDSGYHYNSKTGLCEDINECTNGQASCAVVEICVNTEGGYRCECPPNWRLDSIRHRCVPIRKNGIFPPGYLNEPVYPQLPPNNVSSSGTKFIDPVITQVEEQGSVFRCPAGYRLGDDNACVDVDECLTGEAKCGPQQKCFNLPGGFMCNCPSGHRLIGDHECEDVNECALAGNVPVCSQNADCVNTVGSYQCKCHNGFRSAPVNDKVCVDVDECVESRPGLLCQQRCNNVWGGYRCSCHRGYRINYDNSTCADVDECTEFKSKIPCVGRCLNEPGSYRCACPNGYRLSEDKRSCIDIDECETGEAPCAKGGATTTISDVCVNTRGSHRCHRITCPVGYRLENKHRCNKVEQVCQPGDWFCTHQPTTISYNFITFVSNLYIPDTKLNLFTMRGPQWEMAQMRFSLRLLDVNAPPSVKRKADINDFLLTSTSNEGLTSLVRPLDGPQSIELEMSMELYTRKQFGGTVIAKLFIYVSEYEF